MQEFTENFVVYFFMILKLLAEHADRKTIQVDDVNLIKKMNDVEQDHPLFGFRKDLLNCAGNFVNSKKAVNFDDF